MWQHDRRCGSASKNVSKSINSVGFLHYTQTLNMVGPPKKKRKIAKKLKNGELDDLLGHEALHSLFSYTQKMDIKSVAACLDFLRKVVDSDGIRMEREGRRIELSSIVSVKKPPALPGSEESFKINEDGAEEPIEERVTVSFNGLVEMCSSLLTCLFYLLNNPTWEPNYGPKFDVSRILIPFIEQSNGNYKLPDAPTENGVKDMHFENHLNEFIGVEKVVAIIPGGSHYLWARGLNKELAIEHHRDGFAGFVSTFQSARAKQVKYSYNQYGADMRTSQFQRFMQIVKKDYPELTEAEQDLDRFRSKQPLTIETAKEAIGCLST